MEKLQPKLFSVMKDYNKEQFVKDVISGIIVAIIALPLSIALALASGVAPEQGIYTAIVAGFVISFLGGSRVQIAGPTAAFATIVAGIVAKNGMDGLVAATIIAGILMILMGVFRIGSLIKYIPYTITTGFTAGIAVTLLIGQIKDFCGLTIVTEEPLVETIEKLVADIQFANTFNPHAFLVGIVSLLVLVLFQQFVPRVPGSLVAVIVGIVMVKGFGLQAKTIGDLYEISGAIPVPQIPHLSFGLMKSVFNDALTIAILASIESLLSAVVADSMIGGKHRSNMELVAQGAGNIASVLFGGIPATGAIARTAANIKNGGRTPIAGMVHSVTLLLILVVLMPYAAWIPMATIAAILFLVAYNMCGIKTVIHIVKTAPRSDIFVMAVTFALTVVFDLVVAIEFGMLAALVLFMKRMSDVTEVKSLDDEDDIDSITRRKVPRGTVVYEVSGPMFFGAASKITDMAVSNKVKCMVIRMRSVSTIDATALHALEELFATCEKGGVTMVFSHVNPQPVDVMKKAGFYEKVGSENFRPHIDQALERAAEICAQARRVAAPEEKQERKLQMSHWSDLCVDTLDAWNFFEDDSHKERFDKLLHEFSKDSFFTKGICKCMYLATWDDEHMDILVAQLVGMRLKRSNTGKGMVENADRIVGVQNLSADDKAMYALSSSFIDGSAFHLDPKEPLKEETTYKIQRALVASGVIDRLEEF